MSDGKLMCERLRSMNLTTGEEAADLIEQQAARIAELEAQLAAVAPAVDAQPVGWAWKPRGGSLDFSDAQDRPSEVDLEYAKETGGEFVPLYASAQSEGLRKDAERLDWLDRNMFHREMNEWDTRIHHGETMWVMFAPNGVQGSARNVIDAVLPQHNTGEKYD